MDIASILDVVIQNGALGAFAAYLAIDLRTQRKQLDILAEKFETQLNKIREDAMTAERELRLRYDQVIEGLNKERSEIRGQVSSEIQELDRKIDILGHQIDSLKTTVDEIKIREIARAGTPRGN